MYSDTSKVTFIPKAPVTAIQQPTSISGAVSNEAPTASHGIGLVGWIGILVLVATIIGAGGLFLYVGYFQSQQVEIIQSLKKKQDQVDTSFIANAQKLGARIGFAKELLENQIYVSPVFEALHVKTLPSIQFDSFELVHKTSTSNDVAPGSKYQAILSGQARSYEVIAQQSDVFATSPVLKTHFFSNFKIDTDKNLISFNLTVDLPEGLGHENDFNQDLATAGDSGTPQGGAQPASLRRFLQLFQPQSMDVEPQYQPEPEQLPPIQ